MGICVWGGVIFYNTFVDAFCNQSDFFSRLGDISKVMLFFVLLNATYVVTSLIFLLKDYCEKQKIYIERRRENQVYESSDEADDRIYQEEWLARRAETQA
jgi:hypothetical protein